MQTGNYQVVDSDLVHDKKFGKEGTLERITKTNHKDVTYYKALLKEYARELMFVMSEDFMEEITGHEIENKAFDDS